MTDKKEVLKKMVENMNRFQFNDKRCQSHGKEAKFCPLKHNEMIASGEKNFQMNDSCFTMDNQSLTKDNNIERNKSRTYIKEGIIPLYSNVNHSGEYKANKSNCLQKKARTKSKKVTENINKNLNVIKNSIEVTNEAVNLASNPIKNEVIIKDETVIVNKDNLENKELLCIEDEGINFQNIKIKNDEDFESEDTEEENLKQIVKKKIIKKKKKKLNHFQRSSKMRKKFKPSIKLEDLEIKPKSQEIRQMSKNHKINIPLGNTEKATPTHLSNFM